MQMNALEPSVTAERPGCVVIDDDPDICTLIARVLDTIGVSSVTLSTADALPGALRGGHPAIVFLDVALDRSDAIDGIRILRERNFGGSVQLISGKDPVLVRDIRTIGERNGLRMLPPLQKPFRGDHLREIVREEGERSDPATPAAADHAPAQAPSVDLHEALGRSWVDMYYQPKVSLLSNVVVGAEGLARIRHPERGLLGPASFLPGASAADVQRLTGFVVRKAHADWEVMRRSGCHLKLAVNAPVQAITDPALPGLIRSLRPQHPSWPGLIVEVTEEEAAHEIDAVAEAAVQLKIYDVTLALDDFGSGYSNFARLRQLPFTEVKLDRSFVADCAADPLNASICRSIIDLAHANGMTCVAEGIETETERRALLAMGCDVGQGYFFGRPMTSGSLIRFVTAEY